MSVIMALVVDGDPSKLEEHAASDPDSAFYFDLKVKCGTYSWLVRPACDSLAWTYYQAVHAFGSLVVSQATLNRAAAYKAALVRQQAQAR